jgi:hypothetical protein
MHETLAKKNNVTEGDLIYLAVPFYAIIQAMYFYFPWSTVIFEFLSRCRRHVGETGQLPARMYLPFNVSVVYPKPYGKHDFGKEVSDLQRSSCFQRRGE